MGIPGNLEVLLDKSTREEDIVRKHRRLIFVVSIIFLITLLNAGCGQKQQSAPSAKMEISIIDSTGREITVPAGLNRLVVLNTNAAEVMRILQVPDEVIIGVTDTLQKTPYLACKKNFLLAPGITPVMKKL